MQDTNSTIKRAFVPLEDFGFGRYYADDGSPSYYLCGPCDKKGCETEAKVCLLPVDFTSRDKDEVWAYICNRDDAPFLCGQHAEIYDTDK